MNVVSFLHELLLSLSFLRWQRNFERFLQVGNTRRFFFKCLKNINDKFTFNLSRFETNSPVKTTSKSNMYFRRTKWPHRHMKNDDSEKFKACRSVQIFVSIRISCLNFAFTQFDECFGHIPDVSKWSKH